MKKFTVHIPRDIAVELRKCRATIREAIRKRLQEIVEGLTTKPKTNGPAPSPDGPPHRFYVYEGFRVSYQVNPATRRVVVTKIRTESV